MSPRSFRASCCSTCSPATRSFSTASGSFSRRGRCKVERAEAIILSVLAASTPLLIAATGELITERAGVLNLGVEGMMIVGAACGFGGAWVTRSTHIGAGFVGEKITPAPHLLIPGLTGIPFIGRILFGEDPFVYLSLLLIVAIWLFLYRTRAGLVLRAVGDNHAS